MVLLVFKLNVFYWKLFYFNLKRIFVLQFPLLHCIIESIYESHLVMYTEFTLLMHFNFEDNGGTVFEFLLKYNHFMNVLINYSTKMKIMISIEKKIYA